MPSQFYAADFTPRRTRRQPPDVAPPGFSGTERHKTCDDVSAPAIIYPRETTLGTWTFDLEIFAASGIIIAGMLEALAVLLLQIISDCATRFQEIRRKWNSRR
jgi:hypothetical protein